MKKIVAYLRIHLKNKVFLKSFNKLKQNQSLSYLSNQNNQLEKLNKILTHAYNHIPYYHKLFNDLNLVSNKKIILNSLDDIQKIPFLTKDIIREEEKNLYADDYQKRFSFTNSSGGSTGEPVLFVQDAQYTLSNQLNTQLAYSWRGMTLYDEMVVLWGAERDIFEGKRSLRSKLEDIYLNRVILNSFAMSEDDMLRYITVLNQKRPKLIKAYAQSIYELAKFAKENKIEVKKQYAIHLAAGTVYDFMRELIEEVFQCKAYNYYGSREVGSIASECRVQDGLHIMQEHTLLEVINSEGKVCKAGEEGEIVLTTLENYSMPLIRYKVGDIGILKKYDSCDCGCTYDKLQKIVGRTTDLFKGRDGKKIDGEYFTHLFYFVPWIKQFQVIQNCLDEIIIKIVKNSNIVETDIIDITQKIKMVMGEECQVIFQYVEEIPKTVTGKFRYTISNV